MSTPTRARRTLAGRPEATSHAAIEQAAFRLFAERGFERTTLDDIAAAVGVSRRTLFRYYPAKADIPWGEFDRTLEGLRRVLRELPQEWPVHRVVLEGVVAFNDFPADADPSHRDRMRLILETPALEAHSVLRYAQWRGVIADYVADRSGQPVSGLLPQVVGHVSLALALTAYERWLHDDVAAVGDLLREAMAQLRDHLAG